MKSVGIWRQKYIFSHWGGGIKMYNFLAIYINKK